MGIWGLATNIAVTVAVSRFAPGLGGSVAAGFAGGAAESIVDQVGHGKIDTGQVLESGGLGAMGGLIGDGAARGLSAAARVGAKRAGTALTKATALSDDATKAAGEWKTADDALDTARTNQSNINSFLHPKKYKAAGNAVTKAEQDAAAAQSKWEAAQIKADDPGFSVSKMTQRKKLLDRAAKDFRGGKGTLKKPTYKAGGWGNTGLRALGASAGGFGAGRINASSGGSSANGGGDGADKPAPAAPEGQKIALSWGGQVTGEAPFVADRATYTADGTGFLLYPKGLNNQIRNWYVG